MNINWKSTLEYLKSLQVTLHPRLEASTQLSHLTEGLHQTGKIMAWISSLRVAYSREYATRGVSEIQASKIIAATIDQEIFAAFRKVLVTTIDERKAWFRVSWTVGLQF